MSRITPLSHILSLKDSVLFKIKGLGDDLQALSQPIWTVSSRVKSPPFTFDILLESLHVKGQGISLLWSLYFKWSLAIKDKSLLKGLHTHTHKHTHKISKAPNSHLDRFWPDIKATFLNCTVQCFLLGEIIVSFADRPCTMLQIKELQQTIALNFFETLLQALIKHQSQW